jgi:hypothetical protein
MNFVAAPSKAVARAHAHAGVGARALVVAMTTLQVTLPPRSPGPGRP